MSRTDDRKMSYSQPNNSGPAQQTTAQASREAAAAATGDPVLIRQARGDLEGARRLYDQQQAAAVKSRQNFITPGRKV